MRKGIVMDIDERFLTLLTPEGEFLKARKQNQNYLIGQEIDFFPFTEIPKKKPLFIHLPGKAIAAAMFALMIVTASFLPIYGNNDVYAYMSIDVNPSIELAVNDDLEVIKLDAFNHEGEEVISKIKDWKRQKVSIVTTQIIDEIKNQGFFLKKDKVLITTVYEDKKNTTVAQKLEANMEDIEEKMESDNLHLKIVKGTKQERKAAQKQGVTTGMFKEKQRMIRKKEWGNRPKSSNENHPKDNHINGPNNKGRKEIENNIVHEKNHENQAPGQQKKNQESIKEKSKNHNRLKNTIEKTKDDRSNGNGMEDKSKGRKYHNSDKHNKSEDNDKHDNNDNYDKENKYDNNDNHDKENKDDKEKNKEKNDKRQKNID